MSVARQDVPRMRIHREPKECDLPPRMPGAARRKVTESGQTIQCNARQSLVDGGLEMGEGGREKRVAGDK